MTATPSRDFDRLLIVTSINRNIYALPFIKSSFKYNSSLSNPDDTSKLSLKSASSRLTSQVTVKSQESDFGTAASSLQF